MSEEQKTAAQKRKEAAEAKKQAEAQAKAEAEAQEAATEVAEQKAPNPLAQYTERVQETSVEVVHFDEEHRELFRFERFFKGSGIWASIFVMKSSIGKLLRLRTFTEWIGVPQEEGSKVSIARGTISIEQLMAEAKRPDVIEAASEIEGLDLEKALNFAIAQKERNLQGQEAKEFRNKGKGTGTGSSPSPTFGGASGSGKAPF